MMRVAMVTTHPIQYQVPWLRMLARTEGVELHVFYAMLPDSAEQGREFGVAFEWDTPLLDGYAYTVLHNRAPQPSPIRFDGCDTPDIAKELRRGEFDAVIVNGWGSKTCLQALIACRRSGIPCIVRGEANGLRPRAPWKQWMHRGLLSQYAAVLAIGSRNREYMRARGVPAARIFDTPYCVDNDRFIAAADAVRHVDRGQIRSTFGLEPDLPTALFSGKLVEKKRPLDAIRALEEARHRASPRLQLLIVGDGPLMPEMRAAAAGLPVHFAGFLNQSEIVRAYVAADCLVLPSDSGETWGLVVNEAMACGLPALVSDQAGSQVDLVLDGRTGHAFACGDVAALAHGFRSLSTEPGRWAAMGEQARGHVTENFNFARVVSGVRAALNHVAGESAG